MRMKCAMLTVLLGGLTGCGEQGGATGAHAGRRGSGASGECPGDRETRGTTRQKGNSGG